MEILIATVSRNLLSLTISRFS